MQNSDRFLLGSVAQRRMTSNQSVPLGTVILLGAGRKPVLDNECRPVFKGVPPICLVHGAVM
jgi:hypothetical protein